MYTIFTDGGARGNPGPAGAGAVIYDAEDNTVAEVSKYLGERTNNWAEYEAVILGLEKLIEITPDLELSEIKVVVKLDSELVQRQMKREYRVKEPSLKEQFARVNTLLEQVPNVSFIHVPRAENKVADALANDAMDKGV